MFEFLEYYLLSLFQKFSNTAIVVGTSLHQNIRIVILSSYSPSPNWCGGDVCGVVNMSHRIVLVVYAAGRAHPPDNTSRILFILTVGLESLCILLPDSPALGRPICSNDFSWSRCRCRPVSGKFSTDPWSVRSGLHVAACSWRILRTRWYDDVRFPPHQPFSISFIFSISCLYLSFFSSLYMPNLPFCSKKKRPIYRHRHQGKGNNLIYLGIVLT